jgi:tricarballylate dehydrogenase
MIYDRLARTIWKQPKGICYCICDAKIEDVPNYKKSIRTEKPPIIAKSIDELADKLGIKQSTLKNTIQRYNDAIQPGEFKPLVLDGKHTEGIVPPKSNWARPIDKPVFIAYPMIGAVVFTFGGLKVTPRAEVLNRDGFVILGLYAAGETVGLFYHFYPGATSVLRGCVFGRLAGDNAAKIMQYSK